MLSQGTTAVEGSNNDNGPSPPSSTMQANANPPHPTLLPAELPPCQSDSTSMLIDQATALPSTSNSDPPTATSTGVPETNPPVQATPQASIDTKQSPELQSQQTSPQKAVITKVKLSDELNIFDWFRSTDIINQIAEKAKNSVDSVITVLDPGMKEYLYSGGNINITVISDSDRLVSPIREAFQTVFGRATVVAARYNPPGTAVDYPVKLAHGFEEAITVAQERIKLLRLDTSTVPQNQVVVVVQPTLVDVVKNQATGNRANQGLNLDENLVPKWFLTYSMIIEDPVLGSTLNSYSQFLPIDPEIVTSAQEAKFPDGFSDSHLGFAKSIGELMMTKLNLKADNPEDPASNWINVWSGLDEIKLIHDLSLSLAHLYRRKWNFCAG